MKGRLKNMVSRAGDKPKDQKDKIKTNRDDGKKDPTDKIPRPMPKPRPKDMGRARLKSPDQKNQAENLVEVALID